MHVLLGDERNQRYHEAVRPLLPANRPLPTLCLFCQRNRSPVLTETVGATIQGHKGKYKKENESENTLMLFSLFILPSNSN